VQSLGAGKPLILTGPRGASFPSMRRFILVATLLAAAYGSPARAGESWVFRPSYYSHNPVTNVRVGRQFSYGPQYTVPIGEHVRSGYRNLHSTIQVGGGTFDMVNVWEAWVQVGSQF